jgi:hypothetical protein
VRYWTEELGVSEDRLRELVRQHGVSARKIREALGQRVMQRSESA